MGKWNNKFSDELVSNRFCDLFSIFPLSRPASIPSFPSSFSSSSPPNLSPIRSNSFITINNENNNSNGSNNNSNSSSNNNNADTSLPIPVPIPIIIEKKSYSASSSFSSSLSSSPSITSYPYIQQQQQQQPNPEILLSPGREGNDNKENDDNQEGDKSSMNRKHRKSISIMLSKEFFSDKKVLLQNINKFVPVFLYSSSYVY